MAYLGQERQLVSWCFEHGQLLRIISGLNNKGKPTDIARAGKIPIPTMCKDNKNSLFYVLKTHFVQKKWTNSHSSLPPPLLQPPLPTSSTGFCLWLFKLSTRFTFVHISPPPLPTHTSLAARERRHRAASVTTATPEFRYLHCT